MTGKKISSHGSTLYLWVLAGVFAGALIGALRPEAGVSLRPLGDGFVALIRMLISPVIFCTVVLGIAGMDDLKKLGRVGLKAFVYFEIVSTLALGVGLLVAHLLKPGQGYGVDPKSLDPKLVAEYVQKSGELNLVDYFLHLIPRSFMDAFTGQGDLLRVLLVAAGAMAFTVGKYGLSSLKSLAFLMGTFYLACALFVFVILGAIARMTGVNIFRLVFFLREEFFTVLGTSSSESALVPLMHKLERIGCPKSVVGLVVPYGYSFNLDGSNIYMTLATLFIAQALGVELTLAQQFTILGVAMLTSKGAAGVTGSGFITLGATLAVVPSLPVAGISLILGIDRFMSEARALTNFAGNAVAALVISRWEEKTEFREISS